MWIPAEKQGRMKLLKKKLAILILISSIFILSACGNTETSSEAEVAEENTGTVEEDAGNSEEDAAGENTENSSEDETDVSENEADGSQETADISDTEENRTVSENDLPETVSEPVDSSTASEQEALYTIKTSAGSNLGMVPVVNGNAVVLMDGSYASTYQGDYTPEETSALNLKLEEETAQALSSGKVDAWAFYKEAQLRDFEFPEGVTSIDKFAFARSGLNSIAIPEGVTSIGYAAFYHCDSLSDVVIPDSVATIEENAFSHTPWLENWLAGGENAENTGMPGDEEMTEVSETSRADDFLIVGDGVLLAYRGSEKEPELPPEVKSIVPGALGE